MMQNLVSIIVPVYNVEDYVAKCLESICRQSYDNIEIIVVNDGSLDGSAEICSRYASCDKRIRYFEQKNYGVSSARNRGLELSTGSFIMFVDADDCLEPNTIEQCIENMDENDMLVFGYKRIDEDDLILSMSNEYNNSIIDHDTMMEYLFYLHPKFQYQGYLCNKFYRAEIIKNHDIHFFKDIKYNEDRLFIFEYLKFCNKVKLISTPLYLYRIRDNSAMGQFWKTFKPDMLTGLKAYEIMQDSLYPKNDSRLYMLVSLGMFYETKNWSYRVPKEYKQEREYVMKLLNQSFLTCLRSHCSVITMTKKIKIIIHYILVKYRTNACAIGGR